MSLDMEGREHVTRYVVTQLCGPDDPPSTMGRKLASPMQGRWTFETEVEAQVWIERAMKSNSLERLEKHYNLPFEARPCPCYPGHFDPMTCWFD